MGSELLQLMTARGLCVNLTCSLRPDPKSIEHLTPLWKFIPKIKSEEMGVWELLRRPYYLIPLAALQGNKSNANQWWLVLLIEAVNC